MFELPKTFPRWAAPGVGAIAGAIVGVRAATKDIPHLVQSMLGGIVAGALVGCLIFLLDRPSDKPQTIDLGDGPIMLDEPSRPIIPRFFTLLSCLLFWAPLVGTVVSLVAVGINWRTPGLRRKLSIGGLVDSLPMTVFVLYAITQE
jgi:hypothetical protein